MMPEMDGFEVCRRLKAIRSTHHIPVLMVTALDQPSDRVQGLEAGADDFLTKPVDDIAADGAGQEPGAAQGADRRAARPRPHRPGDRHRGRHPGDGRRSIPTAAASCWSTPTRGTPSGCAAISRRHHQRRRADQSGRRRAAGRRAASYELALVSMALGEFDPLRVCSQMRTARADPDCCRSS